MDVEIYCTIALEHLVPSCLAVPLCMVESVPFAETTFDYVHLYPCHVHCPVMQRDVDIL